MPYIKPTNNQHDAEKEIHDALDAAGVRRGQGEWFETDLGTAIRCINKQVDTNWPSTEQPFAL